MVIMISGWAHGPDSLQPIADELRREFEVSLRSPAELASTGNSCSAVLCSLLKDRTTPSLVLGWSMGGMIAMEAALAAPGMVAGLVLLSSTARFCSTEDYPHGTDPLQLRAMALGLRKDPKNTLGAFFELASDPQPLSRAKISRKIETALHDGIEPLAAGLNYLAETDLRSRITGLHLPVLLFHGKRDRIIPWAATTLLAKLFRKSEMLICNYDGHDLPARCPQLIASELTHFYEKHLERRT